MKVLIDLEEVKKFIKTLSYNSDEWYGQENTLTLSCIIEMLEALGKTKAHEELSDFKNTLYQDD
jgi:hypothetical protein